MEPMTMAAIASTAYDYYNQSKASQATGTMNKRSIILNMLNRQWEEQMMDKQNEYNKPINQMKRLEEAGLNPNLVYGNANAIISSASPASGSAPWQVTPSQSKLETMALVNGLRSQQLQNKQLEANIEATKSNQELQKMRLGMQASYQDKQLLLQASKLKLAKEIFDVNKEAPKSSSGKFVNDILNLLKDSPSTIRDYMEQYSN